MSSSFITYNPDRPPRPSLFGRVRLRLNASLLRKLSNYLPGDAVTWARLGTVELLCGDFAAAEQSFLNSLDCNHQQPLCQYYRGVALERMERPLEAMQCYAQAIALDSRMAEAAERIRMLTRDEGKANNLGNAVGDPSHSWEELLLIGQACLDAKEYRKALEFADQAAFNEPNHAAPYRLSGAALLRLGRLDDARRALDRAIELDDSIADIYRIRAEVLRALGRPAEALDDTERAIARDSANAEAYAVRGSLLKVMGRFEESLASIDTSLALKPDDPRTLSYRGGTLIHMMRIDEALASVDRAIDIDPGCLNAIWNKAICKLMLGEIEEGFSLYESRIPNWGLTSFEQFGKPLWRGEIAIEGRTLLVTAEQGMGDIIQFCRYVPMLEASGARIIIDSPEPLTALLGSLSDTAIVVQQGQPLPPFDMVCPVTSLPFACDTTHDTIPHKVPYLHAVPEKRLSWRNRIQSATGLRVGLVWSGGFRADQPEFWHLNARRNVPLSTLAKLDVSGVTYFSLQKGNDAVAQLELTRQETWRGPEIIDLTESIVDFSDTAALIENLDLVITVDTSVAHLTGALGKPVWILNRFDTCWRWMLDRSDSPWYPTARIFRQPRPDDWDSVIAEVRGALTEYAGRRDMPNLAELSE